MLKNQNVGRSWTGSASLQKTFRQGFAEGRLQPTARRRTRSTRGRSPSAPGTTTSTPATRTTRASALSQFRGHRFFIAGSYRLEYLKFGTTTFSAFFEGYTQGAASYTFCGRPERRRRHEQRPDLHPARPVGDELPGDSPGSTPFIAAEQAAAWDAYINQDSYLNQHRGEYARARRRPAADGLAARLRVAQDLFKNLGGAKHSLQFRADILNFRNLLNSDWGVGQRLRLSQPLTSRGADSQGRATYQLRTISGQLLTKSLESTAGQSDVYPCSSACATASTRTLQSNGRRAGGGSNGRAGLPRSAVRLFGGAHSRAASGGLGGAAPHTPGHANHAKSRIFWARRLVCRSDARGSGGRGRVWPAGSVG